MIYLMIQRGKMADPTNQVTDAGPISFNDQTDKREEPDMNLSARNPIKGRVIIINKGAVNSIGSLDIGGGNIIVATISCAAVEELGLEVGSDAYAVITATSVMVGIDDLALHRPGSGGLAEDQKTDCV